MPSNSSGHYPLTHYERTKKFKSSNYGTTTTRLSGEAQVAFGHCSLSLAPIMEDEDDNNNNNKSNNTTTKDGDDDEATVSTIAMVTPSGHLYGKQAILEYLLTRTAEYKEKMAAYEKQQQEDAKKADDTESRKRQRLEAFEENNQLHNNNKSNNKKAATMNEKGTGKNSALNRTSYWLPDMQPDKIDIRHKEPERPSSPFSGETLRRKDLRELELKRRRKSEDVICAISGKTIRMQSCVAYWVKDNKTSSKSKKPGVVVLKDVYDLTIANNTNKKGGKTSSSNASPAATTTTSKLICPLTNQKIKHIIELKSGGSAFAAHNQVEVKTYKPTIT